MTTFRIACSITVLIIAILWVQNGPAFAGRRTAMSSTALVDTPSFSIPLIVNENNYVSFAINFGIHPRATSGIDPLLGEQEIPPIPPTFDARFGGPCGGQLGCGVFLDLRPYSGPTQIDTYKVSFNRDEAWGLPFIFSWPDLSPYYSGSVRFKMDISGSIFDIDMKTQHLLVVDNLTPNGLPWIPYYAYIIAEGPLAGTSQPIVSTYGHANGAFEGIVHTPPGAQLASRSTPQAAGSTDVWFEYGSTQGYGTATTHQSIADGSDINVSEPFDPGSLPMNSRLHFRAVAQNTVGTFYGGDRIISNGTPPAEAVDTSGFIKYRTATYRNWADAKDQKGKRKAIKCKADKVQFRYDLTSDVDNADGLHLEFAYPVDTSFEFSISSFSPNHLSTTDPKLMKWDVSFDLRVRLGYLFVLTGYSKSAKPPRITKYWWVLSGSPASKVKKSTSTTESIYRLPMPNLHNVGEDIYGGVMQTPVNIVIGITDDPKGAHTAYHPKYKDVLKSLVKEGKGGDLYHSRTRGCINTFDKSHQDIAKAQKSLPPDKHNNLIFAEQLTLKLNLAASDSGIFPTGLGALIYGNGTPFDNTTVQQIAVYVDSFLACPAVPPKGVEDSSVYVKVLQDINSAFSGPMDTTSWSCNKVICTGVKMLMDVPYLRASPNAVPLVFAPRPSYPMNLGPDVFALHQNYPNPFNPTTTISFELEQEALVTLKIYNTLGQEVAELIHNELMDEGTQDVDFDASALSSGVYYYKVIAEDPGGTSVLYSSMRKMMFIK